jgi:hypothetical protein
VPAFNLKFASGRAFKPEFKNGSLNLKATSSSESLASCVCHVTVPGTVPATQRPTPSDSELARAAATGRRGGRQYRPDRVHGDHDPNPRAAAGPGTLPRDRWPGQQLPRAWHIELRLSESESVESSGAPAGPGRRAPAPVRRAASVPRARPAWVPGSAAAAAGPAYTRAGP